MKYDPLCTALHKIKYLPVCDRVKAAARQLTISTIRAQNVRCQIDNLLNLKTQGLYPKCIYVTKLPIGNPYLDVTSEDRKRFNYRARARKQFNEESIDHVTIDKSMHQNREEKLDSSQFLKDTTPLSIHHKKEAPRIGNKVNTFRKFLLGTMIKEKHALFRTLKHRQALAKEEFQKFADPDTRKYVNCIIEEYRKKEKCNTVKKHANKLIIIKKFLGLPVDIKSLPIAEAKKIDENSNTSHPGVSTHTSENIDEKVLNILDKGRNFVPAPQNLKEVKFQATVGIERLAYAMRSRDAQISRVEYAANNEIAGRCGERREYKPHPIREVTSLMTKDSFAVRSGKYETEDLIRKLRGTLQVDVRNVSQKSIIKNMTKSDRESISSLRKNDKISVIMSDKTNKICIIDEHIAKEKEEDLTKNDSFVQLAKDPSPKTTASLNEILSMAFCDTEIPSYYYSILKTQHGQAPSLYSLSKDHKPDWPDCKARAVMPIKNSSLEKIDILVSRILTQYRPFLTYRVDNTEGIIQKLKNCKISTGEFMFSLDVEQMFPNIPTCHRALEVIKLFMEKYAEHIDFYGFKVGHIIEFIKFIFNNSYVENQGKYFRQVHGLCTGAHSSVIIGDIIIDNVYITVIQGSPVAPRNLTLFVDDSWALWKEGKDKFEIFLQKLNSTWETLKFVPTYESEDRSIVFLDVKIRADENLELHHEHYVKPTSSHRYLHYQSHSPISIKINIIRTEASRIIRNCSSLGPIYSHLEELKAALIASGYPSNLVDSIILPELQKAELGIFGYKLVEKKNEEIKKRKEKAKEKKKEDTFLLRIPFVNESYTRKMKSSIKKLGMNVKVVVKPGLNLRSLLTTRKEHLCTCISCEMNIPCNIRNYVYEAECLHCKETYLGASHRPGRERLKEYESSIRLPHQNKRTTLGRHKMEKHNNESNTLSSCYKFRVVDRGVDSLDIFLKEGLHIKHKAPAINGKFNNGFII